MNLTSKRWGDGVPILKHLEFCYVPHCNEPALFDIAMRHGGEYPACSLHAGNVLAQAFADDGDHGHVSVFQIGVHPATLEHVYLYGVEVK